VRGCSSACPSAIICGVKISITGQCSRDEKGQLVAPFVLNGPPRRVMHLPVPSGSETTPVNVTGEGTVDGLWAFRGRAVWVLDSAGFPAEEILTRIKHAVLREEHAFSRMKREVEAFENMEAMASPAREAIPPAVRLATGWGKVRNLREEGPSGIRPPHPGRARRQQY
jgi:hypothetical protein